MTARLRALRLGLGDAVGLVVALTIVLLSPVGTLSTTGRQAALVVGAAAVAPWAIRRARQLRSLGWPRRVVLAAAWVLAGWAALGTVLLGLAGEAPWVLSVYGWFGRGLGLLSLVSAAILLTAGITLTLAQAQRLAAWIVWAATASAFVVLVQSRGSSWYLTNPEGGFPGTMGNSNFAAALSGMTLPLAVALAVVMRQGARRWLAWLFAAAALLLGLATVVAGPLQGPGTAAVGLLVGALVVTRLTGPRWARLTALGCAGLAALLGLLSIVGLGPLAFVWHESTLRVRMVYWRTALRAMLDRPFFGSGPDGFARWVGAYRPEDYLDFRGPEHHVSAAHDVPLQLGATLGVPALVAWVVLMVTVAIAVIVACRSRWAWSPWLVAGLAAAWSGYVAQSLVSIDAIGLLAAGWAVSGALVAVAVAVAVPAPPPAAAKATGRPWPWWLASALAAGLALMVLMPSIVGLQRSEAARRPPALRAALESEWTPCAERPVLARQLVYRVGETQAIPVLESAWDSDRRCPGLGEVLAEALITTGRDRQAAEVTAAITAQDPLNTSAWILEGVARAREGDVAGALIAQEQATRLAAYEPRRFTRPLAYLDREIRRAERR